MQRDTHTVLCFGSPAAEARKDALLKGHMRPGVQFRGVTRAAQNKFSRPGETALHHARVRALHKRRGFVHIPQANAGKIHQAAAHDGLPIVPPDHNPVASGDLWSGHALIFQHPHA